MDNFMTQAWISCEPLGLAQFSPGWTTTFSLDYPKRHSMFTIVGKQIQQPLFPKTRVGGRKDAEPGLRAGDLQMDHTRSGLKTASLH